MAGVRCGDGEGGTKHFDGMCVASLFDGTGDVETRD